MNLLRTFRIALLALLRNKLRSFLTTLGIIIGVAAVIAMVAIGEGAKATVEATYSAMGSNLIIVIPGSSTTSGVAGGFGSMPTLTWSDLKAIQTELPSVRAAAPQLSATAQLVSGEQNWSTSVRGTTPEYFDIRNWKIARGNWFTEADVDAGTKNVVLGQTVVDNLFGPNADPVGQTIRINNVPFEVVGVAARKGQSAMGQDYDDTSFVPVSTFQSKIEGSQRRNAINGVIFISAVSESAMRDAENETTQILRERHRLREGAEDDFSIRNLSEIASAREEGTRTLTTLLASVAAVSLLVGGIGIMNIMLVSVTERTREIGIRMAVGAKPFHILLQFLVEALTLSVAGGLIGVGLGTFTAERLAAKFEWPLLLRPDVTVIAVGFSAAIGIIFGLYPAQKASRLDPIEALRYE